MRGMHSLLQAAGLSLAILSSGTAARAEIFNVCSVAPTPDGFVALRDSPSPAGRLIAQMHPNEVVVIDVRNHDLVRSRGWLHVAHYPGEAFPNPGDPEYRRVTRGWVKEKLVDDCG